MSLARRFFILVQGGRIGQPTIHARPTAGGWQILDQDGLAAGHVRVTEGGPGYRWTFGDGHTGTCMTLGEAVSQLVGAEVLELIGGGP